MRTSDLSRLSNRELILDLALNFARIGRFFARSPETAAPFFTENRAYLAELDRRDLPKSFLPTYRAASAAFADMAASTPDRVTEDAFTWALLLERRAGFAQGEAA